MGGAMKFVILGVVALAAVYLYNRFSYDKATGKGGIADLGKPV